jgi:hypothetical protein
MTFLKTDVNVSTEGKKQNKLEKVIFFVGILEVTDEKSQIRIRKSVRIQGSGSIGTIPKCDGSPTLAPTDL